jgi:hypothetical protein
MKTSGIKCGCWCDAEQRTNNATCRVRRRACKWDTRPVTTLTDKCIHHAPDNDRAYTVTSFRVIFIRLAVSPFGFPSLFISTIILPLHCVYNFSVTKVKVDIKWWNLWSTILSVKLIFYNESQLVP